MAWVEEFELAGLADVSAAELVRQPTLTQAAVDERVGVQAAPIVADAIANDPPVADAAALRAAEIAANDLGLVRSTEGGTGADTVIGPDGSEDKTWLQYNIFVEPTGYAARLLWRVIRPMVLAEMPRLVVSATRPTINGLVWWVEVDTQGRFVALHEGRA